MNIKIFQIYLAAFTILLLLSNYVPCVRCDVLGIFNYIYTVLFDRTCTDSVLVKDISGLQSDLKSNLFGQPLVAGVVVQALKGHIYNYQPSKPLALSFHGWTGSGKNYVTDFIINRYFKEGHHNPNVHMFIGKVHFFSESESDIRRYQKELSSKIINAVTKCKYSIFVFDEVDKFPPKVLDVVKPFLDYKYNIDGVDFRHAIFIFISNIGSNVIVERTLELWKSGFERDDLKLRDFEKLLLIESFNEQGGFYRSDVIDSHLIDHFVPFLPLEKEHVIKCIEAELLRTQKRVSNRNLIIENVVNDLLFGPEPENIFSIAGCKRVSQLVQKEIIAQHYSNDEL